MSRRYGRNQKRKHKQIIQNLIMVNEDVMDEIKYVKNTCKTLERRLQENANQLHRVLASIEKICHYSILLPPKILYTSHLDRAHLEVYERRLPAVHFEDLYAPTDMKRMVVDIYALETYLREHWGELGKALHVTLSMPDKKASSYAVASDYIEFMPEEQKRRFADEIFELLFRHISKQEG